MTAAFFHVLTRLEAVGRDDDDGRSVLKPTHFLTLTERRIAADDIRPAMLEMQQYIRKCRRMLATRVTTARKAGYAIRSVTSLPSYGRRTRGEWRLLNPDGVVIFFFLSSRGPCQGWSHALKTAPDSRSLTGPADAPMTADSLPETIVAPGPAFTLRILHFRCTRASPGGRRGGAAGGSWARPGSRTWR